MHSDLFHPKRLKWYCGNDAIILKLFYLHMVCSSQFPCDTDYDENWEMNKGIPRGLSRIPNIEIVKIFGFTLKMKVFHFLEV